AIKDAPDALEPLSDLGRLLDDLGRSGEAVVVFRRGAPPGPGAGGRGGPAPGVALLARRPPPPAGEGGAPGTEGPPRPPPPARGAGRGAAPAAPPPRPGRPPPPPRGGRGGGGRTSPPPLGQPFCCGWPKLTLTPASTATRWPQRGRASGSFPVPTPRRPPRG